MEGKRQADQSLLQIFSWINAGIEPKRSEVYAVLDSLAIEVKLFMMAKTTQIATRRYISLYFTQLKDTRPMLKGSDLIRMGIQPGPSIKKKLEDLLKARLDEQVVTRQDEMDYLSKAHGME
jgi:tRNA nucleotidyltransferase (CCA-adding enzyme)